ncbi:MAG: hypothetical protein E7L09_05755 [Enterobacteriaceae bacterium]|nr:hypothetical protein [Enterobacteriaceae bacterium]
MAKPNSPNVNYTQDEIDYIQRVAGKVPAEVIAQTLNKSLNGLQNFACRHRIKLRVPYAILTKHWPEIAARRFKGVLNG